MGRTSPHMASAVLLRRWDQQEQSQLEVVQGLLTTVIAKVFISQRNVSCQHTPGACTRSSQRDGVGFAEQPGNQFLQALCLCIITLHSMA